MSLRIWGIALVAALALGAAGCGADKTNSDAQFTIRESVNGQMMRVDLAPGKSKGLAIWFHGQGGNADTRMNEDWLNSLRINGWAVASSDFHGNAWGSAEAVADVAALTKWAANKAGQPATLYVAGSMGGLTSLNSLTHDGAAAKCWYGTMPVVDQSTVSNVPDAGKQITAVYGAQVPADAIPARNIPKLPSIKYRVLSSPDDTWVPAKANASALASGLRSAGREVSTLAVKGEHGDSSHFNPQDLLAFARDCR